MDGSVLSREVLFDQSGVGGGDSFGYAYTWCYIE